MSDNILPTAVDDEIIPAEHHNQLVLAFLQDIVPRNAARIAEDLSGQLGSSLYRWARAYLNEIRIGAVVSDLKIYEGAAGELWFERKSATDEIIKLREDRIEFWINGTSRFALGTSGIDWATQGSSTIPFEKISIPSVSRSSETEGNLALWYTTTYRARVTIEIPHGVAYDSAIGGLVIVWAEHPTTFKVTSLVESFNDAAVGIKIYTAIVPSGTKIYLKNNNPAGAETIYIHLERL